MLKFYLTASFLRREEAIKLRSELLLSFGSDRLQCTSRWLTGERHNVKYGTEASYALQDIEDVKSADVLIQLTGDPVGMSTRGGRHTELGSHW